MRDGEDFATVIPTRDPDIHAPKLNHLFEMKMWIEEDIVGFDQRGTWNYFKRFVHNSLPGITPAQYLKIMMENPNEGHHKWAIEYAVEKTLLEE